MKKLLSIFIFIFITSTAFSQQLCQASFTYNYNPVGGSLNLYDNSYNFDSTQINVNTWQWTIVYGGATYTYSTQNPVIPLNGFTGSVYVCLNIYTTAMIPCQSSICDSINLGTTPVDSCAANFSYQIDTVAHQLNLFDASQTISGVINSWSWVVTDNNGLTLFTSNQQYPVMPFQLNIIYHVCLTMGTDAGCSAQYCNVVYLSDSNNTNCQLFVTSNVGNVSVANGNDGFIDLTVTGGTPPYTFNWNTGVTTEDISNLSSGIYTVAITSASCPSYSYTFQILEPFDSSNIIVDTLYAPVIDTCLNFVVDSSYIASISVQGNNVVVEWILVGGGMTQTLFVTYIYSNFGTQVVVMTLNCNGAKSLSTYYNYIYISQIYSVTDIAGSDQIKLYPNPVSDFLNIAFGNLPETQKSISIFTSTGQMVYSSMFNSNSRQVSINVNSLPSGVYYVRMDLNNDRHFVKKFVK